MLPTEQYSGDAVPTHPWTPDVWRFGPDVLVEKARQDLWQQRRDIEGGALGAAGEPALAGHSSQPANEAEELVDGTTPGETPGGPPSGRGRASVWEASVRQLYKTSPLSGDAEGGGTPTPNPNA